MRRYLGIMLAALIAAGLSWPSAAFAGKDQILTKGKDEYAWNCSACHGPEGRGDGSMSKLLVKPPPNLRTISSRNSGVFPFWRVFQIIDGTESVPGHDTFQMPKYWQRFRADAGRPGFDDADLRLLMLTHYLESLQEQPARN